jgi:hypothetical protein
MYIALEQALEIYDDLHEALSNDGIVEVFLHKIMPVSLINRPEESTEEEILIEKKAAEDFHSLCHIFSKKQGVEIKVDGLELHVWISKIRNESCRFHYKVIIEVNQKQKTKKP